jgi:hypothetical protein
LRNNPSIHLLLLRWSDPYRYSGRITYLIDHNAVICEGMPDNAALAAELGKL